MSSESSRWPLLEERAPFATAPRRAERRRPARSAWLLTGLAFLCGGLVSAAGLSIGWRHQAQRDTAARTALAAETARANRLSASLATARGKAAREKQAVAQAAAAVQATSNPAAAVASKATTAGHDAVGVSAGAEDVAATATKVSRELQTLLTYLTTTPTGQIDPGYVGSQATYLTRQLTALQDGSAVVSKAVTSLKATLHKLERDAAALSH
jgi:type IV secretory pathway TrbL component